MSSYEHFHYYNLNDLQVIFINLEAIGKRDILKLFIDLNKNEKPNYNEVINTMGFQKFGKNLSKKNLKNIDLFKKSLIRFEPSLKIEKKIEKIIYLFNKSNNFEIIRKSSDSSTFRSFLSSNNNVKNIIKNVAFIARFDKPIQESPYANAIILTVNFVKEGEENPKVFTKLVSIDVLEMQANTYDHSKSLKFSEVKFVQVDNSKENELLLSNQDFSPLIKLQKSLNTSNDQLRLKEYRRVISTFREFLDKKQFKVDYIYNWSHKNIYIKDGERAELYVLKKDTHKFSFDKKIEKFIIGDPNGGNFFVNLIETEKINIEKLYEEEKLKIQNEIDISNLRLNEYREQLTKVKKDLDENKKLIKNYKKQKDILLLELKKFNQKKTEYEKTLKKLINEKENLENQSKKYKVKIASKKNQYSENNNLDMKKLNQINEKINKLKKNIEDKKEALEKFTKIVSVKNVQIKENLKDLIKIESNIKSLIESRDKKENTINKEEENLNILEECIEKMSEKYLELKKENITLFKVSIIGDYEKFGRNSISEITLEKSSFLDIIFDRKKMYTFSDFDAGLAAIVKRFDYTFQAYWLGYFKSPYAGISLDKPEVEIQIDKNIKVHDLELNEGQQKALNASSYAHFASILQGPPGTGKTQVISASVFDAISKGQNVLISSATHAAIDNAMERINKNMNDPNIFMVRYSYSEEHLSKNPELTSNALYKSFLNKIDGFVNKANSDTNKDMIETIKNASRDKNFVENFVFDVEYAKIAKNFSKKEIEDLFIFLNPKDDYDEKYAFDDIDDSVKIKRKKVIRNPEFNYFKIAKFINDSFEPNFKNLTTSFSDLVDSIIKIKSTKFEQMISKLNKELNNREKSYDYEKFTKKFFNKSNLFASYLFNNDCINVIGITTTAKLEFGIQNENKNKELFSDYKIDLAIIDEVSKSITPEILSIARLASRFMFAGDYRQLPPQFKISGKLIEEYRHFLLNDEKAFFTRFVKPEAEKGKSVFKEFIDEIFENSLFVNQVEKMKSIANSKQTSYQALTTQYRFNEHINQIVNLTYDTDEKLSTFHNKEHFKKYSIGKRQISNAFATIIDTSFVSEDVAKLFNGSKQLKTKIPVGSEAFDQKESLLFNRSYGQSLFNDFNAFVIVQLIKDLFEKNDIEPKDVGIIAMTKSQAKHISFLLNNEKNDKWLEIKVDTVDNFQGQEREIIILDLVRARYKLENWKVKKFKSRNVDFYEKPERINVAISRGKAKVIVVGAIENYLANCIESNLKIDGKVKKIKLFDKWKKLIKEKGDFIPWEKY